VVAVVMSMTKSARLAYTQLVDLRDRREHRRHADSRAVVSRFTTALGGRPITYCIPVCPVSKARHSVNSVGSGLVSAREEPGPLTTSKSYSQRSVH
jgi:hypothetical protein